LGGWEIDTTASQRLAVSPLLGRATQPPPFLGRATQPPPFLGRATQLPPFLGRATQPHPSWGGLLNPHHSWGEVTQPPPGKCAIQIELRISQIMCYKKRIVLLFNYEPESLPYKNRF